MHLRAGFAESEIAAWLGFRALHKGHAHAGTYVN
jgi:hypothetical protein